MWCQTKASLGHFTQRTSPKLLVATTDTGCRACQRFGEYAAIQQQPRTLLSSHQPWFNSGVVGADIEEHQRVESQL